jgi:trk system potassium uptake protein TrkH
MFVAHTGHIIARLLIALSGVQTFAYLVAIGYGESGRAGTLLAAAAFTAFCSLGLMIAFRGSRLVVDRRVDVFTPLIVLMLLPVFAALPFVIDANAGGFWRGYFEAISAITTTGASLFATGEELGRGLYFYRALLEWGGGLLTVVMVLAVLTHLNIGALQLYDCGLPKGEGEATGERMRKYGADLVMPYAGLTLLCVVALVLTGEDGFRSWTVALATVSSGGFVETMGQPALMSNPAGEWILSLFMLAAGLNLPLFWYLFRLRRLRRQERQHAFIYLRFAALAVAAVLIVGMPLTAPVGEWLRGSFFSAVSAFSTTGFISSAAPETDLVTLLVLVSLAFLGASVASTSGGIKAMRLMILFRHILAELRHLAHPHDAFAPHFAGRLVDEGQLGRIWLLIFAFGITLTLSTLLFSLFGFEITSAVALSVSALSNTGPLIYMVDGQFAGMESLGNWGLGFFAALMILGRLEIVAVLSVISAGFWRR